VGWVSWVGWLSSVDWVGWVGLGLVGLVSGLGGLGLLDRFCGLDRQGWLAWSGGLSALYILSSGLASLSFARFVLKQVRSGAEDKRASAVRLAKCFEQNRCCFSYQLN